MTAETNVCYCGAYGGGKHTKSARCDGSPEPSVPVPLASNPKLDFEQRQRAQELADQCTEDSDALLSACFELISLRDEVAELRIQNAYYEGESQEAHPDDDHE